MYVDFTLAPGCLHLSLRHSNHAIYFLLPSSWMDQRIPLIPPIQEKGPPNIMRTTAAEPNSLHNAPRLSTQSLYSSSLPLIILRILLRGTRLALVHSYTNNKNEERLMRIPPVVLEPLSQSTTVQANSAGLPFLKLHQWIMNRPPEQGHRSLLRHRQLCLRKHGRSLSMA